ncbi:MAG: cysteine-rich CWC family protein [Bacteroidota bacterium]
MSLLKNNQQAAEKICPRCGRKFACTGDESCWCLNWHLPAGLKAKIQNDYHECLCETCFQELGAKFLGNE